jgi:cytochrome c biogenesis protein CcdA
MSFKPVQIFGFIMSFAYVFLGMLFLTTSFAESVIVETNYRKIFGGVIVAYGLFRVAYFLRKLREKS